MSDDDSTAEVTTADTPDAAERLAERRDHVERTLVTFVRALARRGVAVAADGTLEAARTLAVVDLHDREQVRAALRSTLVTSPADWATFDSLFDVFWAQLRGSESATPDGETATDPFADVAPMRGDETPPGGGSLGTPSEGTDGEPADVDGRVTGTQRRAGSESEAGFDATPDEDDGIAASVYSPTGRPERIGTGAVGPDRAVERAVASLVDALAAAPGRRWERGDEQVDAHRMLRESVGTGGAVLSIPRRRHERTALDAVILVDVSRSVLEAVDRSFLLAVLGELNRQCRSLRVFFFDTDVRDVTDAVESPAGVGSALDTAEAEWGGGTRIGHSLATIRREYPHAVDRSTRTLVVSDGLEVGEIETLEREMARLSRRSAGVLWLNPLAASSEYEPTCRGMAAALPYVDGLFAFTDAADIDEIARQLHQQGFGGAIGYQYDHRRRSGGRDAAAGGTN